MNVGLAKSRFINALRCYANYALSRFGLVRITHMPAFVSVEPASVCQLHCPECPVGQGNKTKPQEALTPFLTLDLWHRVLSQIKPFAHTVQFYFQGEPLLNKDLPQMIREAHEAGLYTIVSTNAQALTPELAENLVKSGLNRIIISMDGLTEETYSAYRIGGSLEQCKKAVAYLQKAKNKVFPIIELQVIRLRTNEQEWAAFKQQYRSIGADRLVFKTAQLYHYENGHPLMPSDPRYSRYQKGNDGHYHLRPRSKTCLRVWSGVVITTDGDVLPCCYDKTHSHAYGSIKETPLVELFSNEKALAFRRDALQEQPKICQECWK